MGGLSRARLYGMNGLPAGSFDANITFAQALTEAARQSRDAGGGQHPASDIEIGGEGGREALERLKNIFARMESAWRPASAEEGFEIVRRRLFQPMTEPQSFADRDAVVQAFSGSTASSPRSFPPTCRKRTTGGRWRPPIRSIPELFDRLYNDWSTLDKFQRTRGVLRLMAAVIHALWEREDASLLIMPGSCRWTTPVQSELTRYLDDTWVPVIEKGRRRARLAAAANWTGPCPTSAATRPAGAWPGRSTSARRP